jgi:hypothetical protein
VRDFLIEALPDAQFEQVEAAILRTSRLLSAQPEMEWYPILGPFEDARADEDSQVVSQPQVLCKWPNASHQTVA